MKSKLNIDDGCNPELLKGCTTEGIMQMPCLSETKNILIPKQDELIPFDKRHYIKRKDVFLHFYIYDKLFAEVIKNPYDFIDEFKEYKGIIGPDNSIYTDALVSAQINNVYRNRIISHFFQYNGVNLIPNVRWGSLISYTDLFFPEKFAFLGIPKNSIVSVGSYGTMKRKDDKINFLMGLEAMIEELTPKTVLIYGSEPIIVTEKYKDRVNFVIYPDWIKMKHQK